MERQTSIRASNPEPRDWESSTLGTRPLPRTKVYLPILSYVLPVVDSTRFGWSVSVRLADPPVGRVVCLST